MQFLCFVNVKNAILNRDTRVFSKMAPLCILEIAGSCRHTGVKDRGKNPNWNEILSFRNVFTNSVLEVKIEDQQVVDQQLICSGVLVLNGFGADWRIAKIPLLYQGKGVGYLDVEVMMVQELKDEDVTQSSSQNISEMSMLHSGNGPHMKSSSVQRVNVDVNKAYSAEEMDRILSNL